jgi:hypothetical protein
MSRCVAEAIITLAHVGHDPERLKDYAMSRLPRAPEMLLHAEIQARRADIEFPYLDDRQNGGGGCILSKARMVSRMRTSASWRVAHGI